MSEKQNFDSYEQTHEQLKQIFEYWKKNNLDLENKKEFVNSLDRDILLQIFEDYHQKALELAKPKTTKQKLANIFGTKKNKISQQQVEEIYFSTQKSLEKFKDMYESVHIQLGIKVLQSDIDMMKNAINHSLILGILSFMDFLDYYSQ